MRALLGVGALVIILAGIRATAALLIPFVLALFLAVITYPIVRALMRWRVPMLAAVIMTMLLTVAVLIGPAVLVVTAVRQFDVSVPEYEERLRVMAGDVSLWLQQRGFDAEWIAAMFDPTRTFGIVMGALSSVATFISFSFLVVLIAAFMLAEAAEVARRPGAKLPLDLQVRLSRVAGDMQIWLWVKTVISAGTGLAAGLLTALLGLEFALLWGVTAFLLNYIPNLGSILAAIPPALVALIEFGPGYTVLVLLGYMAINVVFGNVMEPYLLGRRIKMSPLVVLLSVIVWGWMWGIAGMLLSVPITMTIRMVLESVPEWRWAAVLMGDGQTRAAAGPSPPDRRSDRADPAARQDP